MNTNTSTNHNISPEPKSNQDAAKKIPDWIASHLPKGDSAIKIFNGDSPILPGDVPAFAQSFHRVAVVGRQLHVAAEMLLKSTATMDAASMIGGAQLLLWVKNDAPQRLVREIEEVARLAGMDTPHPVKSEHGLHDLEDIASQRDSDRSEDVTNACCRNLVRLGERLVVLADALCLLFANAPGRELEEAVVELAAFGQAFGNLVRDQAPVAVAYLPLGLFECSDAIGKVVHQTDGDEAVIKFQTQDKEGKEHSNE